MLSQYEEVVHFSEADWYEAVRLVMPPQFRGLEEESLDEVLEQVLRHLTPEEQENILRSIGKVAKSVGKVALNNAGTIGTIAGGALGTVIGGPAGTAIGAKLGGTLGGVVQGAAGGKGQVTSQPQVRPLPQARPGQVTSPSPSVSPAVRPATQMSQQPAARTMMLSNHYHFLIQVVQAVIESVLRVLLERQGKKLRSSSTNPSEVYLPLEDFQQAIEVYSQTNGDYSSASGTTTINLGESSTHPDQQADEFYYRLFGQL